MFVVQMSFNHLMRPSSSYLVNHVKVLHNKFTMIFHELSICMQRKQLWLFHEIIARRQSACPLINKSSLPSTTPLYIQGPKAAMYFHLTTHLHFHNSIIWRKIIASLIILIGLIALSFSLAMAADHSALQDFCVHESDSQGICLFVHICIFIYISTTYLN